MVERYLLIIAMLVCFWETWHVLDKWSVINQPWYSSWFWLVCYFVMIAVDIQLWYTISGVYLSW